MDYSRDEDGLPRKERELTLSMSAILGIFFGLVLLCGLFFGLGYNMRGRQISAAANSDPDAENSANPAFNNFKPAAGSPAGSKPVVVVAPGSATPGTVTTTANSASLNPANSPAATPANSATPSGATPSNAAPIVRLAAPPSGHPTAAVSGATPTPASGQASGQAAGSGGPTAAGTRYPNALSRRISWCTSRLGRLPIARMQRRCGSGCWATVTTPSSSNAKPAAIRAGGCGFG